jgi:hypothetical protein
MDELLSTCILYFKYYGVIYLYFMFTVYSRYLEIQGNFFFQYKRNLKHFNHITCFVYPTLNVEQKCVVSCQFITMLTILQCLNDELDYINSFNIFNWKQSVVTIAKVKARNHLLDNQRKSTKTIYNFTNLFTNYKIQK